MNIIAFDVVSNINKKKFFLSSSLLNCFKRRYTICQNFVIDEPHLRVFKQEYKINLKKKK